MTELKLNQVDSPVGVISPQDILIKLGGMKLSPCDPDIGAQMEVARGLMKTWRNVLSGLGAA